MIDIYTPDTPNWTKAITDCGLNVRHHPGPNPVHRLGLATIRGQAAPVFVSTKDVEHYQQGWMNSILVQCTQAGDWYLAMIEDAYLIHPRLLDVIGMVHPWWDTEDLISQCQKAGGAALSVQNALTFSQEEFLSSIIWQGPMLDLSGYANDTYNLVQWTPDVKLQPIQWGSYTVRRSTAEQKRLRLRSQGAAEPRVFIQSGFPDHFQPQEIYHVGRTMYEASKLPDLWAEAVKVVDELWVPSQFCVDLFSRYHDNVHLVPSLIDVVTFAPRPESFGTLSERKTCKFLFLGEWIERKNWRFTLDVLSAAFTDEPVELIVKTHSSLGKSTEIINQEIKERVSLPVSRIVGILNDTELSWLYNSCHCLLHFAHSEGFGRPVAEMLACGGEVLSHGETGLMDVQPDPLPATWVQIPKEYGAELPQMDGSDYQWCDIDFDVAVEAVRESYRRWESGQRRDRRQFVIEKFSGPIVYESIYQRLTEILEANHG